MKKATVNIYDSHFGSILCKNNVYETRIVSIILEDYNDLDNRFIRLLTNLKSANQMTIYNIYNVIYLLDYDIEEIESLKLNIDFKREQLNIENINYHMIRSNNLEVLIRIKPFYNEKHDVPAMYTYTPYIEMARKCGKSKATKLMLNSIYGLNPKYDYKMVKDYFNKLLKEGENKMIYFLPNPKRVICSGPVTTVIYGDGTKTHVRKMDSDVNDYEKAFLLSWLYKTYGKKNVNEKLDEFKKEFVKE